LKPVAVKGLGDDVLMDRGAFGLDYVDLIIKKGNTIAKRFWLFSSEHRVL